jgi:hypothetical protein
MTRDDDFEPKLGRIRSRGSWRRRNYLHRVLRAVALAGGRPPGGSSSRRSTFQPAEAGAASELAAVELPRQHAGHPAAPRTDPCRRPALGQAGLGLRRRKARRANRGCLPPVDRTGERSVHRDREESRIHAGALAAGAGAQPRQTGLWYRKGRYDFVDAGAAAERAVDIVGS